jgi:hypothetical protein
MYKIILIAILGTLMSCSYFGFKKKQKLYSTKIIVESFEHIPKLGDGIYFGVGTASLGEVVLVKTEKEYSYVLIELYEPKEIEGSRVSERHPDFKEPVLRIVQSKMKSSPVKFIELIIK